MLPFILSQHISASLSLLLLLLQLAVCSEETTTATFPDFTAPNIKHGANEDHLVRMRQASVGLPSDKGRPILLSSARVFVRNCLGLQQQQQQQQQQPQQQEGLVGGWFVHYDSDLPSSSSSFVGQSVRLKLEQHMDRVIGYISHDSFLVYGSSNQISRATREIPEIVWVHPMQPQHKLSFELEEELCRPDTTININNITRLSISLLGNNSTVIAAKWRDSVDSVELNPFTVNAISNRKILITTRQSSLRQLLIFLSHDPNVHWIETARFSKFRNIYARWLVQNTQRDHMPYWEAGLRGQGQVLGLGDTGVNSNVCFFYDPSHEVPFNVVDMNGHRKFTTYNTANGDRVDNAGHGSHIAGAMAGDCDCSLAGSGVTCFDELANFNGMAPKAKLAFQDLNIFGEVQMNPSDLYSLYFPVAYAAGARIRSDSWGDAKSFGYTSNAAEIDEFSFEHRDFISFWAVGNDGAKGYFTIGAPATCKNCVSVGASQSVLSAFVRWGYTPLEIHIEHDPTQSNCPNSEVVLQGRHALFGKPFDSSAERGQIVSVNPIDACEDDIKEPVGGGGIGRYNGSVVIVSRGICTFTEKAMRLQRLGAVAMIVYNYQWEGDPIIVAGHNDSVFIFVTMVSYNAGMNLRCLGNRNTATAPFASLPHIPSDSNRNENNLAGFSGRGPTMDLRLKPDIVTIGEPLFSINTKGANGLGEGIQTDIMADGGTSMASPVAAATAALIRQYYVDGFYPSGRATPLSSMLPSGALIKATVLSCTRQLTGVISVIPDVVPLSGKLPNYEQGHGQMDLSKGLPLGDDKNLRLWVQDEMNDALLGNGLQTSVTFRVKIKKNGEVGFKVVLVWTDYPGTVGSGLALVNDLDLIVTNPNGSVVYYGNNNMFGPDRHNNVESISIPKAEVGTYLVTVQAYSIIHPQTFAIVVTGQFDSVSRVSSPSSCPGYCGGKGRCVAGVCECTTQWTGPVCNIAIEELISGSSVVNARLSSVNHWKYYTFTVPDGGTYSLVTNRGSETMNVQFYLREGVLPDHWHHDQQASNSQTLSATTPTRGRATTFYLMVANKPMTSADYKDGDFMAAFSLSLTVVRFGCGFYCREECTENSSSCVARLPPEPDWVRFPAVNKEMDEPLDSSVQPLLTTTATTTKIWNVSATSTPRYNNEDAYLELTPTSLALLGSYSVFGIMISAFVGIQRKISSPPSLDDQPSDATPQHRRHHHHQYQPLNGSIKTAYILWFFFGIFGAHRFYLGRYKSGILWMLTGGMVGFGWLFDAFFLVKMVKGEDTMVSKLIPRLRHHAMRKRYEKVKITQQLEEEEEQQQEQEMGILEKKNEESGWDADEEEDENSTNNNTSLDDSMEKPNVEKKQPAKFFNIFAAKARRFTRSVTRPKFEEDFDNLTNDL